VVLLLKEGKFKEITFSIGDAEEIEEVVKQTIGEESS